jgi:IPT/TIG domain
VSRRRSALASFAIAAAALLAPAGASGQVTLGQLAPPDPQGTCFAGEEAFQVAETSGSSYVVPGEGAITSWSTSAGPQPGQRVAMKLLRITPDDIVVVAHDGPRALVPSTVNTFRTAIPAESGDIIALATAEGTPGSSACTFPTGEEKDEFAATSTFEDTETPDGWPLPELSLGHEARLNLQATFLREPEITSIAPDEGPLAGGTQVVLEGVNLAEVLAVAFGDTPAKSFKVNSEHQIVAVAPASAKPGEAPVMVATVAGLTIAPESFEYFRAPPRIASLDPSVGSVTGGTSVTISGSGFSEVQGVAFSGTPAQSYTVSSAGKIVAVAPPSKLLGSVGIEVATSGGTVTAPRPFVYEGCLVPELTGATLAIARKLLLVSGCRPGKVKKRYARRAKFGKVVAQSAEPGKVLPLAAKVGLRVLLRRPRP